MRRAGIHQYLDDICQKKGWVPHSLRPSAESNLAYEGFVTTSHRNIARGLDNLRQMRGSYSMDAEPVHPALSIRHRHAGNTSPCQNRGWDRMEAPSNRDESRKTSEKPLAQAPEDQGHREPHTVLFRSKLGMEMGWWPWLTCARKGNNRLGEDAIHDAQGFKPINTSAPKY